LKFAGKIPIRGLSHYCATKHALIGFYGALRLEEEKNGLKVTVVCPGYVVYSKNSCTNIHRKRGVETDMITEPMEGRKRHWIFPIAFEPPKVVAKQIVKAIARFLHASYYF
jgi:short-subunit dehydrogenase